MIKYQLSTSGYFSDCFRSLAEQVGDVPGPREIQLPHPSMKPLCQLIYLHDGEDPPKYIPQQRSGLLQGPPKRANLEIEDEAIIGYSGGKDSIAQAIKLQKEGINVEAFHLGNLNRSCTDEKQASIDTCKLLGIPLRIETIKTTGKSKRLENPVKNLLVLAMMLDFGLWRGVSTYALGTQINRPNGLSDFYTSLDFSDSPDVLFIGSELFRQLPQFRLRVGELGLSNIDTYYSMKLILSHKRGWELLTASRSCMTQFRFREMRKKHNHKKYGVELLPGRCGSCWKCCIEYLVLDALGAIKKNEDFILHCWRFVDNQKLNWDEELVKMLNRARRDSRKSLKDAF